MKDDIYTMLNDMDQNVEAYESLEVTKEDVRNWKKSFQKRKGTSKSKVGKYVVAAVAVLAFTLVMGPFYDETYAGVKVATSSIKEWLGVESDLTDYETAVGKSVAKDGLTITLNEVIVDGETMMVSYTTTASQKIETIEEEMEMLVFANVSVNGRSVSSGSAGGSERIDDYNIVSLDEIALEDINVEKEQFYKISFYDGLKQIGSIEFVASGKELATDTVRIPIEASCEFPDESVVTFTELAMNPVSTKIYMTATVSYGKYDINLRGYDDLGNEIGFYLTHFGDGKGWFVLEPEEENYIREEASSLTLTVYAAEYPEESGKMNDDYRPIGEPFTIELP